MAKENEKGKENFFKRAGKGIAKWFREMKSELKKVVWPGRKQVIKSTVVALVIMAVSAIALWLFDSLASLGVEALINLTV